MTAKFSAMKCKQSAAQKIANQVNIFNKLIVLLNNWAYTNKITGFGQYLKIGTRFALVKTIPTESLMYNRLS